MFTRNPIGTTFLASLSGPECGGDTIYLSATKAYYLLSPAMTTFLERLTAVHSGLRQSTGAVTTNIYRRQIIDNVHPVVRKHPVTGRKSLWVNYHYTTRIVELKLEESDAVLQMLFNHLKKHLVCSGVSLIAVG